MQSLAIKYRPTSWDELVEQETIRTILQNQLDAKEIKNAYLFVGGAGTGKTTCARLFASAINHGVSGAIEIDGASNNGVDQVREISSQAKMRSIDTEYKIFIIDECHMITIQGWNAMLKLIEEPPLKTIFIFCTTNPEKIPKTILSRVQRYDFKQISLTGIFNRLVEVCQKEGFMFEETALIHIAKMADGHLRDALTLLDKVVAYDKNITEQNIITALGIIGYEVLFALIKAFIQKDEAKLIEILEDCYRDGQDLKQFIDNEIGLVLDFIKWKQTQCFQFCYCPNYVEEWFKTFNTNDTELLHLLDTLLNIKNAIKYDTRPLDLVESILLLAI